MPEITAFQALQFFLIVLALPLQYILVEWAGNTSEISRARSIKDFFSSSRKILDFSLDPSLWKAWISKQVKIATGHTSLPYSDTASMQYNESVAEEVFRYRNPSGYFAGSPVPRKPRSKHVKYRVGQVIKHKKYGYRGVIIGWDDVCKAPLHWIEANHQGHQEEYAKQPNYAVLVDVRDSSGSQTTYVVEQNIEIIKSKVKHKEINDYFDFFDGSQYHMRPALKHLYPFG